MSRGNARWDLRGVIGILVGPRELCGDSVTTVMQCRNWEEKDFCCEETKRTVVGQLQWADYSQTSSPILLGVTVLGPHLTPCYRMWLICISNSVGLLKWIELLERDPGFGGRSALLCRQHCFCAFKQRHRTRKSFLSVLLLYLRHWQAPQRSLHCLG